MNAEAKKIIEKIIEAVPAKASIHVDEGYHRPFLGGEICYRFAIYADDTHAMGDSYAEAYGIWVSKREGDRQARIKKAKDELAALLPEGEAA